MEDEDKNSKSLVLITRVGSTPTTGIEKRVRKHRFLARLFYWKQSSSAVLLAM